MLTPVEIKTFIDNDASSTKKHLARLGQRYYEADHDIRQYRIFFVDADGQMREDKTKSNIKISHPFFTELVDQEVQYMLSGKDGFVKSDIPELQSLLDDYFNENEDFLSELYEIITGCISKGFEYAYAYKAADGRTAFQCADSIGVVEVKAKETVAVKVKVKAKAKAKATATEKAKALAVSTKTRIKFTTVILLTATYSTMLWKAQWTVLILRQPKATLLMVTLKG